jgi:hypothetical protein
MEMTMVITHGEMIIIVILGEYLPQYHKKDQLCKCVLSRIERWVAAH